MKLLESPRELSYQNGVPFVIWCYWEGDAMEGNRKLSFEYFLKHIEVPVALITPKNLHKYIQPEHPFPEGYPYLSIVHRSDYIRAYLMHYYGGGWHDIKATEVSYKEIWREFENPNIWLIGRHEVPNGAAKSYDDEGRYMPNYHQDLVAVPSWVARPNTPLSKEILERIESVINDNYDKLKKYPAKHPREKKLTGKNLLQKIFNILKFTYQGRSLHYPLDWTLFGNIFHPTVLKYKGHISKNLPVDSIKNAGIYHRG